MKKFYTIKRLRTALLDTDEGKSLYPRRLLFLHNLSSLFTSEAFGVIMGSCLQQLLVGLLFLIISRESSYMLDPGIIHDKHLKGLTPAAQIGAYSFVWLLLLVWNCLFAMVAKQRLARATFRLVKSMRYRAMQRRIMLLSPTVLSEVSESEESSTDSGSSDESLPPSQSLAPSHSKNPSDPETKECSQEEDEGILLNLEPEEESLLNPVRAELSQAKFKRNRSDEELLEEERRLVMGPSFMRYIGWQLVVKACLDIPTWAVPDVVSSIYTWLTQVWARWALPKYLQLLTLTFGVLLISAIVLISVNQLIILRQSRYNYSKTTTFTNDDFKNPELSYRQSTWLKSASKADNEFESSPSVFSRLSRHVIPPQKKLLTFLNFASQNIQFSLGLALGMSIEILLSFAVAQIFATSYIVKVLNSLLTIIIVAFIQLKFLDTSFEPSISVDCLTNIKRFISVALTFLVALSVTCAMADTKDLAVGRIFHYSGPSSTLFSPNIDGLTSLPSNQTVPTVYNQFVPLRQAVPIMSNQFVPLGQAVPPMMDTSLLRQSESVGEAHKVDLSITGEFFVAVACTLPFVGIVGLLTLWQHRMICKGGRLRYRQNFTQLVILACGTVIGWGWSNSLGVFYKAAADWVPPDRPWISGVFLVCFVFLVLQICCIFSIFIIFAEEKVKEKWRLKLQQNLGMNKQASKAN